MTRTAKDRQDIRNWSEQLSAQAESRHLEPIEGSCAYRGENATAMKEDDDLLTIFHGRQRGIMTQDYEPIELNENTPAPKENHAYYLVAVEYDGVTDYKLLYLNSLLWFGIGSHEPAAWPTVRELLLSEIAGVDGTVTIQSLAAHDAEVRDKALALTDDELTIAEGAYESSIMECESDGFGAMSIALKAVAEDRRSHEHRDR